MSDTGGDDWRLATTADFVAGVIPEPGSLALAALTAAVAMMRRRVSRGGVPRRRSARDCADV